MSIIRSLDSFSLPELFKLIEEDSKSGRLIVETPISQETAKRKGIYYVWFKDGYLIAFSNCLNQKGLIELIEKREWLSPAVVSRLRKLCPTGVPLGTYLKKMKLLNQEKLNLVFQLQLHQVYSLFEVNGGRFRFDDFDELQDRILTIPWLEMTGHRIKTREASMYALRLMENSPSFVGQLPAPNQMLTKIVAQPQLKLTTTERQLWDMADSQTSLLTIAISLQHTVEMIQMTAFRLIAVGLVDAIFQQQYEWSTDDNALKLESEVDKAIAKLGSDIVSNNQQAGDESDWKKKDTSLLNTLGSLFRKKNL
ncbi:MAG: DUF4388 domain-containing protein [Pleurocapsa sp.]